MKIFQVWMGENEIEKYDCLFPGEPLNILISYAHAPGFVSLINCLKRQGKISSLIMDSGTYTLNKKGAAKYPHVTFDSYKSYMKDFHRNYDIVINFDEDHSTSGFETNYENQLDLEAAGIPVVPVVQDIEGEELGVYLADGSDLIALGSSQIKRPEHLDIVFAKLTGTKTKIHLLGKTEYKFLIRQPLYSADSSSSIQNASKGVVLFWNDHREADANGDKTDMINLEEFYQEDKKSLPGIPISEYRYRQEFNRYLLGQFKIRINDLRKTELNLMKKVINMRYYKILEKKVTEYHRQKGWIDDQDNLLPIS